MRLQLVSLLVLASHLMAWNISDPTAAERTTWALDQIESEFQLFAKGFAISDIKRSFQSILDGLYGEHAPVAYVEFDDGVCRYTTSAKCLKLFRTRAEHFCRAVQLLHELRPLPNFALLLSLDQCFERPYYLHLVNVPVFTISKSEQNKKAIRFPRAVFDPNREKTFQSILNIGEKTPFEERQPVVFWRLKTFERRDIAFDWRLGPTVPLLYLGRAHPTLLDFAIPKECQSFIASKISAPLSKSIYAPLKKIEDHVDYRYLLAFDQRSSPCDLEPSLFTGSVVLRCETPFSEWFTSKLRPGYHYVPLDKRCNHLFDAIDWCQKHKEEAEKIAQNALDFALEELSDEKAFEYFYHLLNSYIDRLKQESKTQ